MSIIVGSGPGVCRKHNCTKPDAGAGVFQLAVRETYPAQAGRACALVPEDACACEFLACGVMENRKNSQIGAS